MQNAECDTLDGRVPQADFGVFWAVLDVPELRMRDGSRCALQKRSISCRIRRVMHKTPRNVLEIEQTIA